MTGPSSKARPPHRRPNPIRATKRFAQDTPRPTPSQVQTRAYPARATDSPCRRPRIPSFTNNVNQHAPTAKPPSRITPPGDPPPREDAYMVPSPPPSTTPPNTHQLPPHPPLTTKLTTI